MLNLNPLTKLKDNISFNKATSLKLTIPAASSRVLSRFLPSAPVVAVKEVALKLLALIPRGKPLGFSLRNYKQNKFYYVLFLAYFLILSSIQVAYSQFQLELPTEFQNLSINARATEKDFDFTVDDNTSLVTQNFPLDKTGVILHLVPTPRILNDNTKLIVFSNDGNELEIFKFIDGSFFTLVDPLKTYSIIQEIKPQCKEIAQAFILDEQTTICPTKEAFKLFENIMLTSDASFRIRLITPREFYLANLTLPQNTSQLEDNFKYLEITHQEILNTEETKALNINIASLLKHSNICFVGKSKTTEKKKSLECTFKDKGIQSLIFFSDDFKNKITNNPTSQNINLVFQFPVNLFTRLTHEILFEVNQNQKSENPKQEINPTSLKKLSLDNYNASLKLNIGQISTLRTKTKKNIFNLDNPIELNKSLDLITFNLQTQEADVIIKPFTKINISNVLTNIKIEGGEKNQTSLFTTLIKNNIIVQNLEEPVDETDKTQLIQNEKDNSLKVLTYLPSGKFDFNLSNTYTFVEQKLSPSVDDKGKPIEVINNKSRFDLIFSSLINNTDFNNKSNLITLDIKKSLDLLNNKGFKNPLMSSGFLIPPDFRPVLEEDYRATVKFSMAINEGKDNFVNVVYSDLKTKDETPLTNFFEFSFLPIGTYKGIIQFDGNRKSLFLMAGILEVKNE